MAIYECANCGYKSEAPFMVSYLLTGGGIWISREARLKKFCSNH